MPTPECNVDSASFWALCGDVRPASSHGYTSVVGHEA
jgi:hypothetical protein